MKAITITLMFNGQTEAAFNFYKSVFGGEFAMFQRMKDMPSPMPMTDEEKEKILYVGLNTGAGFLAGMDMPPGRGDVEHGNDFMITLNTSGEEETTKLFNALADGGSIMMPLDHQFWGAFFGMVKDQFGIQWMLSYTKE
jgi:PhnB protein